MEKNIKLEKTPANNGLPQGWYKEPGFPVWYTRIFGIKIQITNRHEDAPGIWFINCNDTIWQQMDLPPGPRLYILEKYSAIIFETALKHARSYFTLCISNVDYKIEQLQNHYQNEPEQ